jgi:ATP-dependent Clp protease, protease subunit
MAITTTYVGGTSTEEIKKNRYFILNEDVDAESVVGIIREIHDINRYDSEKESKVVDYEREPITLVVNTYGGSVYDGFALLSEMVLSKTPIHTICQGKAMSMGFILMLGGHKRFMTPFATLMYHEISTAAWDKITGIKQTVEEAERLQRVYDNYVLSRTNLMQEKLDDIKERKMEWYLGADDAKKLGIIDEILS